MGVGRADDDGRLFDRWSDDYLRFTRILIAVATLTIFATVGLQLMRPPYLPSEVAAQLMLLVVLIAAVRGGAGWGMAAAMFSSLFYVLLKTEVFSATDVGVTDTAVIATRLVAYGLVGVVGGEIFSRLRHGSGLSWGPGVDHWVGLRDSTWGLGLVRDALERWESSQEPFTVLVLTVSESAYGKARASHRRSMLRGIGRRIKSAIRMSDDVAWLDDGRFLILLRKTTATGAQAVWNRVALDLGRTFRLDSGAISVTMLDGAEGRNRFDSLLGPSTTPSTSDAV